MKAVVNDYKSSCEINIPGNCDMLDVNNDRIYGDPKFHLNIRALASSEIQGQLVRAGKSLNGQGKNLGEDPGALSLALDFSSPELFPCSFRLFPAPTNCPWVSEDGA